MMPVMMPEAGSQGGPGSQVWTPSLCLQVMVAGKQVTGKFGGWGGHRPDGVSSSEGPGAQVGQFKGACWCDPPWTVSAAGQTSPVSVQQQPRGGPPREQGRRRSGWQDRFRPARIERKGNGVQHRAGLMLRERRDGSLQPGRVSV